jgi:thioredoxin 1
MNALRTAQAVMATTLLWAAGWAQALTLAPYSADELGKLQQAGKPVAVHFHAEWCSTCKSQERSLDSMKSDPALNDMTVLVADYDKEKELRKALKVRSQSIMVVYKGSQEVWRVTGQTQPHDLKAAFAKAL